jgi:RNA polymerase primary sigma factor
LLHSRRSQRVSGARNRAPSDEGSLDQYLRDISIYPLISRDEEIALAKRIRTSDQEALDTLVRSNLRFVVSVAKKYQNQGVSLSDLINEGNLGLIRAAHKFDETKGIKFISYAVWWIRQAILQALAEQSRIVRVPLNRAGTLHRIGKRASTLLQELGREPTHSEIAEGMDISEEEVAKTMSISQAHLSLDAPIAPGEDSSLLERIADVDSLTPDEQTFEKALTEAISESLASLKERESKILRLYFGLDNQEKVRADWDEGRRLRGWVASTESMDAVLSTHGTIFGDKVPLPTVNPTFAFTIPKDGSLPLDGVAPSIIDHQGDPTSMESIPDLGARLRSLTLEHPDPAGAEKLYRELAVEHPPAIVQAPKIRYRALIETPTGLKELT